MKEADSVFSSTTFIQPIALLEILDVLVALIYTDSRRGEEPLPTCQKECSAK